jgi:purine-binding chemotaxis protein CheW
MRPGSSLPARIDAVAHEDDAVHEYLGFVLAHERYALPLAAIREILKPPPVTEVPRAPRDVLGVVSVRGRVITVLDLRRRLRMAESPVTKATRVLLLEQGDEVVGMLVDRVLSVFRMRSDEIEVASTAFGDTADYVVGIGRPTAWRLGARGSATAAPDRDELLVLLDPKQLLRK